MTAIPIAGATTSTPATTRSLLTCAVVAAPLWAVVSLAQAATREGFDLTRHPLSSGSLGWLQITNFLVAGVLTVVGRPACAASCTAHLEALGRPG